MNGRAPAGVADIAAVAAEAGLRRVHVLAWRDLVDIEAGGSEVHAAKILALWAEAGIEVVMRTSYAQGHPYEGDRDGYHIVRKHGRFMVFPTAVVSEVLGGHGPRDGIVEIWNGVPFLTPMWARGPRIAWVHHVHRDMWDMVLDPGLARAGKFFEHRVAPPLYRRTPVVTLSESSRHELIDYLGLRPAQISVVPPGIDDRFTPGEPKSDVPLVVAAGRLMPSKRFDELVRIAVRGRAATSPTCSSSSSVTATSAPTSRPRWPSWARRTGSASPGRSPTRSCSRSTAGPGSSPAPPSPRAGA